MFDGHKIQTLENRIDKLESAIRSLQVEWDDVYARIRRVLSSVAKRDAMLASREADQGNGPTVIPSEGPARSAFLTPRQLQLQQEILKRRAGG